MFPIIVLASAVAVAAPSAKNEPLSKADSGFLQCYEPNEAAKTCQSIAAYTKNGDGTWDNTAIVLISATQPVTLETVTPVKIINGAVCGYIRSEDVLKGKLRYSGQLIPEEKAAPILVKISAGMAPFMNKEICTEYVQVADDLIAKGRIEGGTPAVPDQKVKWILASDGYTVAPIPKVNAAGG